VGITFPGESAEYRAARDRLLEQEVELRRATEAVAAARRELPPGGVVPEDYAFQGAGPDGSPTEVRLSELFAPGKDSLLIYSFMFPRDPGDDRPGPDVGETARLKLEEGPCPSCVALLDQLDGAAEHVAQLANFAVVAKAPLPRVLAFAEERGWRRLRQIPEIGSWTLAILALHGQGRLDHAPCGDLGLLKLVGRLRSGGDPRARATEQEVHDVFAPYGEYAGLAAVYALRGSLTPAT